MNTDLCLTCSRYRQPAEVVFERFLLMEIHQRLSMAKIKLKGLPEAKFCLILQGISLKSRFITHLELQGNRLTEWAIQALVNTRWKFVCKLNLSKNSISGLALSHLKRADWSFLKYLNLSINPIGNCGVEHLCRCKFPRLEWLLLKKTNVTSSCFRVLTKSEWRCLKELNFCECELGVLDLSFLQRLGWSYDCKLDLHTDDSRPVFGWSASLAKVPPSMAGLKVQLCSRHTLLNSPASIQCLCRVYPRASDFLFIWSDSGRHRGVEYYMASSDDNYEP